MALLATNRFAGDGITTSYEFNFVGKYIARPHVKVYQEDNVTKVRTYVPINDSNFLNDTTLRGLPVTPVGSTIVIYRETHKPPLVDFVNGSRFTEYNMDLVARQGLFVAMEAMDAGDAEARQQLLDAIAAIGGLSDDATAAALAAAASAVNAEGSATLAQDAKVGAEAARDTLFNDLASTAEGKGGELMAFKQGAPGAVATTVQAKLREFVSVKDFGGEADGSVSDQAAFVAARDNGKAYFIPSGNYDLPLAFDSQNTPIISLGASIDKGVPASTYLRSFLDIGRKAIYRQSIRGAEEYSSTPTTYSYITDLVSLDIRHQNGAGYQQFFNNDSGGRTAVPAIYIEGSHFGYGDVPGVSVHYGISRHPNWASISGNWTGANSVVCFDGAVQALTPNVNVYGAEYHLGDNGNGKVAANGLVLDFARNNGNPSVGGAYNTVWTGVRLQTSGTYAADSGLSINGKWNVGIDFSGATLTNNAAIALKTSDRIYFGVSAVAPPLWHANTLSNTYMSFEAGSLNFVNAGVNAFKIESTAVTSTPEHKFTNSMNFVSSGYIANTVGAAGGAAVLPAAPFTYLKIKIDGVVYKIPVYNN